MRDPSEPVAGPSNHATVPRTDATLLRQFVIQYLQLHGFDKALAMFQQGIADQGDDKDADGEDEAAPVAPTPAGGAAGKEAIFRAPGPIPIDSTLKRNIPQAQAMSASTMSERITPEFQAQANYIIEMIQKRAELRDGDGEAEPTNVPKGDALLDPSDRVNGYRKYRRWVDDGLDIWKVSPAMFVTSMTDARNIASPSSTRYPFPYLLRHSSTS